MQYYTVEEAAGLLKVAEATIRKWVKGGKFPHSEKNGHWRIPQCCLDGHPDGVTPASVAAVAAAVSEPRVPTATETLQADTAEKEARLANQKATAEVEKWDEREASLVEAEGLLRQDQAAVAAEREEVAEERERVESHQRKVTLKATELLKVQNEAVPRAEKRAEEILTEAFMKVETMKREAAEEIANSRAVRDATLEAAKVQIARAEKTMFDADQLRILQSRVAALPDKVRAKHFPKVDRAFLPLRNDKKMPVSDPDKSKWVAVDRGFAISEESKWTAITWAFWVVIVAIFGWALWQWLKLIGG